MALICFGPEMLTQNTTSRYQGAANDRAVKLADLAVMN
jgi:hypothetical protein